MIPAGASIKVLDYGRYRVNVEIDGRKMRLGLDYGRQMALEAWAKKIVVGEDPRRTITEIGLDLGYTDAANFTRAYRRANGISPSAARKQRLGLAASA